MGVEIYFIHLLFSVSKVEMDDVLENIFCKYYCTAIHEISTQTSLGNLETSTHSLAGSVPGVKKEP